VLVTALATVLVPEYITEESEVCEFFVKKDKLVLCKVCNKEYAYHGGTSNLWDHLCHAHPAKLHSLQN